MSAPPAWADLAFRIGWLEAVAAHGFCGRETDVAVAMFNKFNPERGGAFTGLGWLSEVLGIEKRNLRRLIANLERAGYLRTAREGRGAESSLYVPTLPRGVEPGLHDGRERATQPLPRQMRV
ncbi:helix-turn-helix domain-containing protein [Phenylobacterium sp. J426]|uniref:helix-turn-helix domain-containing protein n=1 Tax=Phenylobacterium sp. J426 TaxID=2898439 RepID=UPI002151AC74|nr:helix-turn-helix domain-containing protein [Phenylobacterium sp. J426]MCR5875701.1 helix-turn-helix domain-containing protein [Phenylobacterium sp. J426]